jgi:hypothetical protein
LTELPLWIDVATVYCDGCTLLKELPLWPNIARVSCSVCALQELPLWSSLLLSIQCDSCHSLKKIPLWPNVIVVNYSGCELLTELPPWPKVTFVMLFGCDLIKERPEWPCIKNINLVPQTRPSKWVTEKPNQIYENINDIDCLVCTEKPKSVIFNCGHLYCCKECSIDLWNGSKLCPICRTNLKSMFNNRLESIRIDIIT